MLKSELRRQIREIKRQFTPQQLEELSLPVVERLKPLVADAQVVLAYYSLPDEVDSHRLLDELVSAGKTVLLPIIVGEGRLELRCYTGPHNLAEVPFHIMEPVGQSFTDFADIDVALIPGVAFDAKGHRLGRGKGFYDRFLPLLTCPTIGVCFDFQRVETVPSDEHDFIIDIVV